MRAPETAGVGAATLKMSFNAWKGGAVAPAEATLPVTAAPPRPPRKPVSPELRVTLGGLGKDHVAALAFAADGRSLAAAGMNGAAKVWDAKTAKEKAALALAPAGSQVFALALHPDGKTLVSSLWRSQTRLTKEGGKAVRRMEYDGEVRLWDLGTRKVRATLKHTPARGVVRLALSPDGRTLATTEYRADETGLTKPQTTLWDVTAAKVRATIPDNARALAFAPDGKALAVSAADIRLYDAAMGKEIGVFPLPKGAAPVNSLAFTREGRLLAGADYKGNVHLWDVPKRARRATWQVGGDKEAATAVAFAPDGRTLAVAVNPPATRGAVDAEDMGQPQVVLWDVAAGKARRTLTAPPGYIAKLAYSPDGRTLACGAIGAVLLWDVSAFRAKE